MNKITLEYDETNGTLFDANGISIPGWFDLKGFEPRFDLKGFEPSESTNSSTKISELLELKNAGFGSDEIVAFRRAGLI